MEAKCDGCHEFYKKTELRVAKSGGVYCWRTPDEGGKISCKPKFVEPVAIEFTFSWEELTALAEYIDGSKNIQVLLAIDDLKERLDRKTYELLKRVLKVDETGTVQQSDS